MDACIRDAKRRAHPSIAGKTVWELFEEEQPFLVGYCGPFDGFHVVESAVSKTYLVRFDNNHYSVAARAVGRPVDVRAYADRIVIRQDGETVAEQGPRLVGGGVLNVLRGGLHPIYLHGANVSRVASVHGTRRLLVRRQSDKPRNIGEDSGNMSLERRVRAASERRVSYRPA